MHIYGKDQQAFHLQRTEAERWWSRLNVLIVVVQLACFLAAIIRTSTNASNSMSNSFFAISPLNLKAAYVQEGCEYNVTRTHAFFRNVTYTMRPDNVGYFVSRGALNIRYLMAITAVHVVVSMLNRLWFETNTHEIRYHFVVFRKDMVTTWEVLLMVLGMVMTWGVTKENQIMTDYLNACNTASGGSYYNSVQPYTELIVSYIVSIAITFINALFAIWNLSKENPRDVMLKEDKKRKEEWEKAMREYYGLPDPAAAAAGDGNSHSNSNDGDPHTNANQNSNGPAGGRHPQVTYANNTAATVHPNLSAEQAGAAVPLTAQQQHEPQYDHPHHHHNYHHAIRKGLGKPFSAISHSLRGRTKAGDPLVQAQHQQHHAHSASPPQNGPLRAHEEELHQQHPPPPAQQHPPQASLSLPQQQQLPSQAQQPYNANAVTPAEPPHVGPSVSRPLTPLLNEEYEEEGKEEMMAPAPPGGGRSPMAPQNARGNGINNNYSSPQQLQQQQQQQQRVSSSHSGRYDLHEVDYDDEPYDSVDADVSNSSPRGPTSSSGPAYNNSNHNNNNMNNNSNGVGNNSGRRAATGSDASTALLNARFAAVPPPPPAFSGDRRQSQQQQQQQMQSQQQQVRQQSTRQQMLAPPSPLQGGGAETTDDTVLQ